MRGVSALLTPAHGRTLLVQDERQVLLAQRAGDGYATATAELQPHGNDLVAAAKAAASNLPTAPTSLLALLPFDPAPLATVPLPAALKAADAVVSAEHEAPKKELKGNDVLTAVRLQRGQKGADTRFATVAAIEQRQAEALEQVARGFGVPLRGIFHVADALCAAADYGSTDLERIDAVAAVTPGWALFTCESAGKAYWKTWPRSRKDAWADQIAEYIKSLRSANDTNVARRILILGEVEPAALERLQVAANVRVVTATANRQPDVPLLWWLAAGLDRASFDVGSRLALRFPLTSNKSTFASNAITVWDVAGTAVGALVGIIGIVVLHWLVGHAVADKQTLVASDTQTLTQLQTQQAALRGRLQSDFTALGKTVQQVADVRTSGASLAAQITQVGSVALSHHTWFTELKVALNDPNSSAPLVATIDGRSLERLGTFETGLSRLGYGGQIWDRLTPEPATKGSYVEIHLGGSTH